MDKKAIVDVLMPKSVDAVTLFLFLAFCTRLPALAWLAVGDGDVRSRFCCDFLSSFGGVKGTSLTWRVILFTFSLSCWAFSIMSINESTSSEGREHPAENTTLVNRCLLNFIIKSNSPVRKQFLVKK